MDPVSQAVFGASFSQSLAKRRQQGAVLFVATLSAMAPDLDILIQSDTDPLLFLEYHRQFTHSLLFIPVGALLCSLVLHFFVRHHLTWRQTFLFALLAYGTHGLLDACTSYGTQLLWPYADIRVAWSVISIVDPLFTLPMLVLIILAARRQRRRYALAALVYAMFYLGTGLMQQQRAQSALYQLIAERGHRIERMHIKPAFGNLVLWKLMYEHNERYYVDAVRLLRKPEIISGESIAKLDLERDFPWLPSGSQQAIDVERFRWFSDDFLAVDPTNANIIMDVRYSFIPNRIQRMWGIVLDREKIARGELNAHAAYAFERGVDAKTRQQYLQMLWPGTGKN